jgi:hypothetical protein
VPSSLPSPQICWKLGKTDPSQTDTSLEWYQGNVHICPQSFPPVLFPKLSLNACLLSQRQQDPHQEKGV